MYYSESSKDWTVYCTQSSDSADVRPRTKNAANRFNRSCRQTALSDTSRCVYPNDRKTRSLYHPSPMGQ